MTDLDRLSDYAENAEMPRWQRIMLLDAVAELRAHRERARIGCTDEEHLLGMAELRQLKERRCETCGHNEYGDCKLSAIKCVQQDPWFSNETLYKDCDTFGNGCNAWTKREGA